MAAKVEALRLTARQNAGKRSVATRFATAARNWAQKGQLGPTATSEMRGYTGAR